MIWFCVGVFACFQVTFKFCSSSSVPSMLLDAHGLLNAATLFIGTLELPKTAGAPSLTTCAFSNDQKWYFVFFKEKNGGSGTNRNVRPKSYPNRVHNHCNNFKRDVWNRLLVFFLLLPLQGFATRNLIHWKPKRQLTKHFTPFYYVYGKHKRKSEDYQES